MSSLARVRVDWTDVHEHAGKPRSQHTGTLLGDALVVIGGVRGGSTLSDVACLDLNSGSWRTVETAGVAFEVTATSAPGSPPSPSFAVRRVRDDGRVII